MSPTRFLIALCLPAQLIAQDRGASGTIRGTVTATDGGAPLPFARISVVGTKRVALTTADGSFEIIHVSPGLCVIQIRLVGYSSVLLPVEVGPHDTVRVRITLAVAGVPLEPIVVKAEPAALLPAMRGFEERRARAQGHFFNRQEIVRMQPRRFTDVLRRIPGVQLQPIAGPYASGEAVRMSRTIGVMGARACPVLYFVNGSPFPVTGDVPIDHYIDPAEVAAIEIYSGMSQIPPEFNSSSHNARCGVIVIWTLSGLDSTQTR